MARDDASASRTKRKTYEKELHKLQVQLCQLQEWVKSQKLRVIILFECVWSREIGLMESV